MSAARFQPSSFLVQRMRRLSAAPEAIMWPLCDIVTALTSPSWPSSEACEACIWMCLRCLFGCLYIYIYDKFGFFCVLPGNIPWVKYVSVCILSCCIYAHNHVRLIFCFIVILPFLPLLGRWTKLWTLIMLDMCMCMNIYIYIYIHAYIHVYWLTTSMPIYMPTYMCTGMPVTVSQRWTILSCVPCTYIHTYTNIHTCIISMCVHNLAHHWYACHCVPKMNHSIVCSTNDKISFKRAWDTPDLCLCIYVCMYVCINIYLYLSMYTHNSFKRAWDTPDLCVCIYVCMYVCMYVVCI